MSYTSNLSAAQKSKALIKACKNGSLEIVQKLVQDRVNINIQDNKFYNYTPLNLTILYGHLGIAEILINNNADITITDDSGGTALMSACFNGHYIIVKKLLENGSDPNIVDSFGNTALIYTCKKGHIVVVKLLIEYGADQTIVNKKGYSALDLALFSWSHESDLDIYEDFLDYTKNHKDLWKKGLEIAKLLIDNGADLNYQDKFGITYLMYALACFHNDTVQFLIDNGANINAKDNNGNTALMLVCKQDPWDVATLKLLLANPDLQIDVKNNFGQTAIDLLREEWGGKFEETENILVKHFNQRENKD